jgi:hypothetical protein
LQSKSEFLKKKEVIDIAAALRIEASPNSGVMEDEVSTRTAMERRHYRKLLSALEASTSQMLATIFSRSLCTGLQVCGQQRLINSSKLDGSHTKQMVMYSP